MSRATLLPGGVAEAAEDATAGGVEVAVVAGVALVDGDNLLRLSEADTLFCLKPSE
jgi:hypothetical protein